MKSASASVDGAVRFGNALLGIDFPNCALIDLPYDLRRMLGVLDMCGLKNAEAYEDLFLLACVRAYDLGCEAPAPEPLSEEFVEAIKAKCLLKFKHADLADALRRVMAQSWCVLSVADRGTYAAVAMYCTRCEGIATSYPDRDKIDFAIEIIRRPFLLKHSDCE